MAKFEDQALITAQPQSIDSKIEMWQNNYAIDIPITSQNLMVVNEQPQPLSPPSIHGTFRSAKTNSFHSANTRSQYSMQSSKASRRSIAAIPKLNHYPTPNKPYFPSDQEIFAELRCLLNELDLTSTTKKQMRLRLEENFKCDLFSKKDLISTFINQATGISVDRGAQ